MRIFPDANILFSAAYVDRSALLVFFDLARAGIVQLASSAFAIEEERRNIASKRPDRTAACERLVADLDATEPLPKFASEAAGPW